MSRPPRDRRGPSVWVLSARLHPSVKSLVDDLRGKRNISEYIRDLIQADARAHHITPR